MRDTADEALVRKRLDELAARAARTGSDCFTEFLTPPECEWASIAARRQGVEASLFGGYDDAERRVARFGDCGEPYPITALSISWHKQSAPTHRDLLGAAMGLGFRRSCLGDIVLGQDKAWLFALSTIAERLADCFTEAGRVRLSVELAEDAPDAAPVAGEPVRLTVSSPRLDAVLSGGFGISRPDAVALIAEGRAKLRHLPTERPDAHVAAGDAISLRGYGRLTVEAVGQPTKKGRIPISLIRCGSGRGR